MPDFPQYLQFLGQSILVSLTLDIGLINDLNSDLLIGHAMPGYFDLIEGALPNSLTENILPYLFLSLLLWRLIVSFLLVHWFIF